MKNIENKNWCRKIEPPYGHSIVPRLEHTDPMRRHEFWYWLQVSANVSQLFSWSLSLVEMCPLFLGASATKFVLSTILAFYRPSNYMKKWYYIFSTQIFLFVKIFITKPLLSKKTQVAINEIWKKMFFRKLWCDQFLQLHNAPETAFLLTEIVSHYRLGGGVDRSSSSDVLDSEFKSCFV